MKHVGWRRIDRHELAAMLKDAAQLASHAVGAATVYRMEHDGREVLAIALPDGQAIVVEPTAPRAKRRRRIDTATQASR